MELPKLNFTDVYDLKIRTNKDKLFIFDSARKSWFLLTPEEWVRQHWIQYMITNLGYSASSLVIEQKLTLNGLTKRLDLLVTEKTLPKILVECKAPHIALNKATFEQIARYNSIIQAEKIILSNGIHHIFAHYSENKYTFVPTIADFL